MRRCSPAAHEDALAVGGALEQELALVDEGERERPSTARYASAWATGPETRATMAAHGRAEAPDERGPERAPAEQASGCCRAGARPWPSRARAGSRRPRRATARGSMVPVVRSPERHLARDVEQDEQPQLDLAGDERG